MLSVIILVELSKDPEFHPLSVDEWELLLSTQTMMKCVFPFGFE